MDPATKKAVIIAAVVIIGLAVIWAFLQLREPASSPEVVAPPAATGSTQ